VKTTVTTSEPVSLPTELEPKPTQPKRKLPVTPELREQVRIAGVVHDIQLRYAARMKTEDAIGDPEGMAAISALLLEARIDELEIMPPTGDNYRKDRIAELKLYQ